MGEFIDQACPVCGTPAQDGEFCTACRWRLHDDPVLGELTSEDVRRARAALEAAGHAWDTRAAALSAGVADRGAGLVGDRLAGVIRGGPPRPGEKTADDSWRSPPNLFDPGQDVRSAEYREISESLVRRQSEEFLFIEFTPDQVSVIKASTGDAGIPWQVDAGSAKWVSLAPMLDTHDDLRRFQLAGGVGTLPLVSRTEFDTTVLHWLKAYIPPSYERSVVLLAPRAGWVLLERAAAAVRTAYPLCAELRRGAAVAAQGTTADAVREVLRTAPLLTDHVLVLALTDQRTGTVGTYHHTLFPAGTRLGRGETATAEVTVHGGVGGEEPLKLPVFAGRPAPDGTGAPAVALHEVVIGPLEQGRLRFVLRGPGEVELAHPHNGTPRTGRRATTTDVSALLTSLPHRILRPPVLELNVTVELSGAEREETEERLTFVRDLVIALARQDATGTAIRTGAVGHYDHEIHESSHTARRMTVLPPVPPGPPAATLAALAAWRPARRGQDLASSLEDALRSVPVGTGTPGAREEDVRRVLLVVARRPPAQPKQHGIHPACPLGADWRSELGRLRAAGVRVVTRADPVPGPPQQDGPGLAARRYADAAWAELCAEGSFRPSKDSAADVAGALIPPWRLDGPPCRLAFAAPLF